MASKGIDAGTVPGIIIGLKRCEILVAAAWMHVTSLAGEYSAHNANEGGTRLLACWSTVPQCNEGAGTDPAPKESCLLFAAGALAHTALSIALLLRTETGST